MSYLFWGLIFIVICIAGFQLRIWNITFDFYPLEKRYKITRWMEECNPPNITYCKKEIHSDYNCETCKWNKKIKL